MGIFGKLVGSKPSESKPERILFSELPDWVDNQEMLVEKSLDSKLAPLIKRIPETLKRLEDRLDELERAGMKKEMVQRVDSILSSSRGNYINGIKKAITDFRVSGRPMDVADDLTRSLVEIRESDLKYGDRVNFGFPEELSKVKKELNKIVDLSNEINSAIGSEKSKLNAIALLKKEIKDANEHMQEGSQLEDRSKVYVDEIKSLQSQIDHKEAEINRLETSDKAERVAAMRSELKTLEEKKREIGLSLLNILGPLKKTFKKYAYAASQGNARAMSAEKYAEDPVEVYMRGDKELPDLFANMIKALQAGVVESDQNEVDKALKKIRGISFANIEKIRSEYTVVVSNIRSLEVRIAEMDPSGDIEEIRREIEGLKSKAKENSESAEKLGNQVKEEGAKTHSIKLDLITKISDYLGTRVEIV